MTETAPATNPSRPPFGSGMRALSPALLALLLSLVLVMALALAWLTLGPNPRLTPPDYTKPQLVVGDQQVDSAILFQSGEILLPVDVMQKQIDSQMYWNQDENKLVVTTRDQVITMSSGQLTAYVNSVPVDLNLPVTLVDNIPFVPLQFFATLYGLSITQPAGSNMVIIDRAGTPIQTGQVTSRQATLRRSPSPRSPGLARLEAGSSMRIYQEEHGWYRVRTAQGLIGYLPEENVTMGQISLVERQTEPVFQAWKPIGEKISLVWEYAGYKTPDMSQVDGIPGLNVVSPTWFYLTDQDGSIKNMADPAYVKWAHGHGYQVWALFASEFQHPEITSSVLRSPALREKVIRQILAYARLYNLDGINIDFENMYLADRSLFVQFMREMTPLLHEQGLTVSVNVTVKSQSENWSLVYDRRALGETADYVMLMAYDEYWASSPLAGPVSSLPWVEKGLNSLLLEVPADKVVLGIPFYTRLWSEKATADGKVQVSSKTLSMEAARQMTQGRQTLVQQDARTGLNFITFPDPQDSRVVDKIWLEDADSLRQRLDLTRRYGLAGIAAWRRGFEVPIVWEQILDSLDRFPLQKPLVQAP